MTKKTSLYGSIDHAPYYCRCCDRTYASEHEWHTHSCSSNSVVQTGIGADQTAKKDAGKAPMELLSPIALEGTAQVLGFGARKYSANGWRKSNLHWTRILAAILRHTFAVLRGEDIDPESGLPHVDHLGCEIMFLQELYRTRKDLDDRYKPEAK